METEHILRSAWKLCAPTADIERGFPRGFWPDVARVAVEMVKQQTTQPVLDFKPTSSSRGGFEQPKEKNKAKLAESILNDLQGMI